MFNVFVGVLAIVQSQVTSVLDLTAPSVVSSEPLEAELVNVDRSKRVAIPLTVSLNLDALEQRPYDPFLFDVIVTNPGQSTLTLPWSDDQTIMANTASQKVQGSLDLVIVTGDQVEHVAYAISLYGGTDRPSTLKTLSPGESVMIRTQGVWIVQSDFVDAHIAPDGTNFNVRAKLAISLPDQSWTASVMSPMRNIRLRRR